MNRQSFTDHMEKCALAAEASALAATVLASAAAELGKASPDVLPDGLTATAVNDQVHNLDVAAGMHNAAATTLLNVVSVWAGMRGDFGTASPSAKDRELATPANDNVADDKALARTVAD
jgi:hypothetical protein